MEKKFTQAMEKQIQHYVYRLIDPRNGQTFYVGKGQANRVFEHVKCAIKYNNSDEKVDDIYKYRIIHEIKKAGLEVIHVIQRWNMTKEEALLVEAVLIDCYQGLSNIQRGHHSCDYGVINAQTLIKILSREVYEEPTDFKYMIIKVQEWRLDEMLMEHGENARYEATRWRWHIRPKEVQQYPYVFSVSFGIVEEVYKIDKWELTDNGRYAFSGEIAEKEVRNRFVNKRIPETYRKKGMASPVLFSK